MKKSIQTVGMVVFFVMIFMIVLIWKIDTSDKIKEDTPKANDTMSKGIDGYILLKGDTVFFIEEKNIKDDYDRKHLEERLKLSIPADSILQFNNPSIKKELQTGDKVKIEYGEILESYPGQIRVTKLHFIK